MRFSILKLLHLTLVISIICAAIGSFYRQRGLEFITTLLNLLVLTISGLGVYYSSPYWRRAWLGFFIYLALYCYSFRNAFELGPLEVFAGWSAAGVSALCAMLLPVKNPDK